MKLEDLKNPSQLKDLSAAELDDLAAQIRKFLLTSISQTGGHLSSNLGVVELTLAMHKVFNSPKDKFIFDVGHQCYTHKLVTGRMEGFTRLRQKGGMSGFPKRSESEYDCWEPGHSSTSISAALGMATARDLLAQDYQVVCVIGDGALSGGMALEALNDLGAQQRKVIIIFNDNNMSISRNHSGLEQTLNRLRTSPAYRQAKKDLVNSLHKTSADGVLSFLHHSSSYLKHQAYGQNLFSQFNLDYLGPIDGHNVTELTHALEVARDHKGPIVVHVVTKKGKGYPYAENDRIGTWHGVGPFYLNSGKSRSVVPDNMKSWSAIIEGTLEDLAEKDERIVAITPAMATGSKLLPFAARFPHRFFDVNIAEQHAMTLAAGMAAGGLKPFVSIYSSFLQRAYDQVSHDVARQNLPVMVGVDRAGLVGEDGDTHQGIYDIGFLRTIPNIILSQPKDAVEAQNLVYTGFEIGRPFFIRYPRGGTAFEKVENYELIPIGTWTDNGVDHPEQVVIAYGPDVVTIENKLKENGLEDKVLVVNARYLKPLDEQMLEKIFDLKVPVTVYEPDAPDGGLYEAITAWRQIGHPDLDVLSLPDAFIEQGSVGSLRKMEGISMDHLLQHLEGNEHAEA